MKIYNNYCCWVNLYVGENLQMCGKVKISVSIIE